MSIAEAPVHRRPDEEPDFGEEGYAPSVHSTDPYSLWDDGSSPDMTDDRLFDKMNPREARRIKEEVGKKHPIDPTNQNQDIRRNGGRQNY